MIHLLNGNLMKKSSVLSFSGCEKLEKVDVGR